ncbi:hypothetical protein Tco_0307533 [Tanacetum coccineum]
MASQDVRLFKFEANFKQQQSKMTNKIDTVLKAITGRIAGNLPSDTVKNPKLSASLVLSACSYLKMIPMFFTPPFTQLIFNAYSMESTISQASLLQTRMEIKPQQPEEPEPVRLFKFEANFKQQQSKMTNKIDTVLKAITGRIAGNLPSDTVKNPKLSASPVLSARSYPTIDPQCSSHPSTSINAIKAHSKEANISQTSLPQTRMGIET